MEIALPPYFRELATDIAAHGGLQPGQSIEEALSEAHARRQAFALEMAEGATDRAKKVRRVLAAQIYGGIAVARTLEEIEREDAEADRMHFVRVESRRIESSLP